MRKWVLMALIFVLLLGVVPFHVEAGIIYETRKGDTLYKIGEVYGARPNAIAEYNGMPEQRKLVEGQALILPGDVYHVRPGDTLHHLAMIHQTTVQKLVDVNGLQGRVIRPGQSLQIPQPKKDEVWTGAYFYPKDKAYNQEMIRSLGKYLSSIFTFSYKPSSDGKLTYIDLNGANKEAWNQGIYPYATVTNLSAEGFDPDLAHTLMSEPTRSVFIENIYRMLDELDYFGVVIDFEGIHPEDRQLYNTFVEELSERLDVGKMRLALAVPPMQGATVPSYNAAYDYKTLGEHADYLFLMTYDWHWPGGPSGPIAPIQEVKKTLDFATSVVNRQKLILGIPMYAYDWVVSDSNKVTAKAYSVQNAITTYIKNESTIHYDGEAEAPWFRYKDSEGRTHEVWFEDPRSLVAKFELVRDYDLGGMGAWQLDFSLKQSESILEESFNVRRK
ncbi:hypothetical protein N781_10600 [Pontibacillus halophilus JSM 076056 = DSM 19796]|uniref:Uncharacterized protein n=1 Tax=Pontibacillus halophilus JSM 076056 = DSM 19796 TaxID=1385510 RepID=A0A0A5GQW6_9BACI|nr:glycosyl hydrolase family 18 protein [Pontibacillus halophilus]KGX93628.1 hypothetical protein N781_10600 [Pontibacillus halophilus JSM 076056 = DSM 19796]